VNGEQIRDYRYAECIEILQNALLHYSQVGCAIICCSIHSVHLLFTANCLPIDDTFRYFGEQVDRIELSRVLTFGPHALDTLEVVDTPVEGKRMADHRDKRGGGQNAVQYSSSVSCHVITSCFPK